MYNKLKHYIDDIAGDSQQCRKEIRRNNALATITTLYHIGELSYDDMCRLRRYMVRTLDEE